MKPFLQGAAPGFSAITADFNSTAIPVNDFIWFNSVLKAGSLGPSPVRIFLRAASIQFTAAGTSYSIPVPDALITFTPGATSASTSFDAAKNEWITNVPSTGLSGNTFLSGVSFPVPAGGLPGGISQVIWSGTFYSDTSGVSINWQWSAAAYKSFATDYQSLGVKPVDDSSASIYQNSDHAATPENYKSFVTAGALGNGGTNYTGSYGTTAWVSPIVQVPNYPPVANAGRDQTTHVGSVVQLDGTGSTDRDGDPLTYRWTITSKPTGSTAALQNPETAQPTFVVDQQGSYVIQLIVNDGKVDSDPSSVTITTENSPPVADAGPNQTIQAGQTVTLDGSKSSDVDGDPLTFQWSIVSQPTGSAATLSDASAVKPTFFGDRVGTYIFRLTVNDGFATSSPATVTVTTENTPPVADAGQNRSVVVNTTVVLDGSRSSDVNGDPITYRWSLSPPANSTAHLSDPTAVNPSFLVDVKGTYVAQLIVNDGFVDSLPATVSISTVNSPPVANAGPAQTVLAGTTVSLNGSASTDVDGDLLSFRWAITSRPLNSTAVLSDPASVTPTFVADQLGTYIAQLIVNDGTVDSSASTVTISTEDSQPVANAGPAQSVPLGSLVTLDGTGSSDADGQVPSYQWSLLSSPTGSTAALAGATTFHPTFTADVAGNYIVQLIVNDGFLNSAPGTVTVSTINSIPVANAGANQSVTTGTTIQLNGSASTDADNDPLTYRWAITVRPNGSEAVLTNTSIVNPTFVADVAGTYLVQLIVNDGKVDSAPATVMIVAQDPNQPPVVSAGSQQVVSLPNTVATLNGSVSDDGLPVGGALTSVWIQVSGPVATVNSPSTPFTTVTLTSTGTYVFRLTGNDSQLSSSADVTVILTPQNQPPLVNAGAAQTITLPASATLNGSASDDGLPFGSSLVTAWSEVAGPGVATFANVNALATQVTFSAPGNYVLRLTASDSQAAASSDVTITVNPAIDSAPPVVNAGPNQAITFPAVASLSGSVSGSGTYTIAWSTADGPSAVVFADPANPVTTATFSQPGTYILRLSATDAFQTVSSDVTVFVGKLDCTRSNAGTDFWLMFPDSSVDPNQQLQLFISGDSATNGTVSIPGLGFSQAFSVSAGQTTTILLPQNAMSSSSDVVENKGIHVVSAKPVSVYGLNFVATETDGYTALPTSSLGTDYVAIAYRNVSFLLEFNFTVETGTEFAVVASQDATTVTVTPSHKTGTRAAGAPYQIQLNQGQTYQLQNNDLPDADLTGSTITADKPVALFSGHKCAFVPAFQLACNHLVEEVPPTDTWGKNFVTVPLATRNTKGDIFRYLAATDGTHVAVNGAEVATLNRGQFFEQPLLGASQISADHPILVAQYSEGGSLDESPQLLPIRS